MLGVGPGEGETFGKEIAWASASESFPRSGLARCASNAKSEYLIPLCGHTRGDGVGVSYKELRRLGGSEEASPLWEACGTRILRPSTLLAPVAKQLLRFLYEVGCLYIEVTGCASQF